MQDQDLIVGRVTMSMTLSMDAFGVGYPIIEWVDENGVRVAGIVAHRYSNDGQFAHNHMSIYSSDVAGNARGIIDIPFGWDEAAGERPQVQFECDIIMKGAGQQVIIREGNEFFALRVGNLDGNRYLYPEKVPSSRIIPASKPVTPA